MFLSVLIFSDFVLIFQLKNRYEKRFINGWPPAGNMEENVVGVAIWIVAGLADRNIRRTRTPKNEIGFINYTIYRITIKFYN